MTERKGRINPLDNKNVRILIPISVVKRILMLAFIPKPINTHPAMYKCGSLHPEKTGSPCADCYGSEN
jgi:hypothetical protein